MQRNKSSKHTRFEQALLDPTANFGSPFDVVDSVELTIKQKVELLLRWQYDARQLELAEDEGMPAGPGSRLSDVLDALRALGHDPEGITGS